jgi:hypothetical protein
MEQIGERVIDKLGPKVTWMGRTIWLKEIYFLCYSDHEREMTRAQAHAYKTIKLEPATLQAIEFDRDPSLSPSAVPVTGRELIEISEKEKCIPQFDLYFLNTHKLTLIPIEGHEFWDRKSYVLNNTNGNEVLEYAKRSRIFMSGE